MQKRLRGPHPLGAGGDDRVRLSKAPCRDLVAAGRVAPWQRVYASRPLERPAGADRRCPSTGRRVSTLWKPPGACGFACRRAWRNSAYLMQFQDPVARAWTKKRRVARRLGSTDPSDYEFPPKPRWMRWATYDRQADRFEDAEDAIQSACAAALQRLLGTGWTDLISV